MGEEERSEAALPGACGSAVCAFQGACFVERRCVLLVQARADKLSSSAFLQTEQAPTFPAGVGARASLPFCM